MKKNLLNLLLFITLLSPFFSKAQVSITAVNVAKTENFNGIGTTGTAVPANWYAVKAGGAVNAVAVGDPLTLLIYATNSATGGAYNTGTPAATDRAIGVLSSGTLIPRFGASFKNNSGTTATSIDLSGVMEQWRTGDNPAVEKVTFEYSFDATSVTDAAATWIALPAMDLTEKLIATTSNAAVDGNLAANRTAISGSISSISWANGATIYVRWTDANDAGTDGIYALDDFSITAVSSNTPTLSATTTVAFGNQQINTTSSASSILLNYSSLNTTDVTVTVSAPYTISATSNGTYGNSLTYTDGDRTGSSLTFYAKFSPTTAILSSNTLNISGGGATAANVTLTGTGTAGDVTPPVNTSTYPKVANITINSADLIHNINESGTTYYVVLPTGGVAPTTTSQVKLGQDGNGVTAFKSGSVANVASTDAVVNLTGLSPNSFYTVYFISEDTTPNIQTNIVSLTITTAAAPVVTSSIIISQYYEGASVNKWIELTNLSNVAVNTASPQLKLALYNISGSAGNINVSGIPSQVVNLNITIPAQGSVLIGNMGNAGEVPYLTAASANQISDLVINFNGNDGIALLDASNNIIDAFGTGVNAMDVSYVRNIDVVAESATFNASDWTRIPLSTVQNSIDGDDLNKLGVHFPPNLPVCASPAVAATALLFNNPTTSSISAGFTKSTDANEYLIIRSLNSTLSASPVDGVSYTLGAAFGGGIVSTKTVNDTFTETGLLSATTYYYFIFPLNNLSCTGGPKYLTTNVLTASETTKTLLPCTTPAAQPTNFNITASNYNFVQAAYTAVTGVDEYLVVMSTNSSLSATPTNQTIYTVGDQLGGGIVVKRGAGNTFVRNSLVQNTDYYFFVYSINSSCTGGPLYLSTSPLTGHYKTGVLDINNLNFYYGNLHAHSSYSDGNKDDNTKTPVDDYAFAKTAMNLDFLGISEHNHTQAGMSLAKWQPGITAAKNATTPTFVAMYGMEWGVISGGGHLLVYGIDSLIGWEAGENQIYVPKSVYTGSTGLFRIINRHGLNAFATLAHPNNTDYNNIASTYNLGADSAIVGTALESGPAFSTNTTYGDPTSPSMNYLSYYNRMLAAGYHLGATIDHDNHNMTFGKHTNSRLVVLAPALTENDLLDAIKKMRFYASEDPTAKVSFKINTEPVGSIIKGVGAPIIAISSITTNPVTSIKLMYGTPGSGVSPTEITNSASGTLNFSHTGLANLATGYYYADIVEDNGIRIVTSPIWYTRDDALPIKLTNFTAKGMGNYVSLKWTTSSETNNNFFTVERSKNAVDFVPLKQIKGAVNSNQLINYSSIDENPIQGISYYRIKQTDFDNNFSYSDTKPVNILSAKENSFTIYPNPVTDKITFNLATSSNNVNLIVTGVDGKIILNETNSIEGLNEKVNAKLGQLTPGVYILKLTANGQVYTNKFIKQ